MLAKLKTVTSSMLLAGGLVFTQAALGLGLGDITLNSTLDEPLDATVELLDVAGLDETQIIIALGSAEDFARLDLERSQFLTSIAFDVELNGATGSIRLTTTANVSEPYLDFVLTARSPAGNVSREYTLLVDLPDFTGTAAAPAPTPAATAPAIEPARTAAPAATLDPVTGDGTFTVNPGDTMWEIAAATRPDASVSVQQMMVAIQRANQDAFVANDINRVRTGRVLRIPPLEEVAVIDQASALAQIGQQNPGSQPLAVNTGNAAGGAAAQGDELSVLTSADALVSGSSDSDLAATIAALENELMLSEESLDRARLENEELNDRIRSLQEQIVLLQDLIAIEDERIAQLQAELASQSQATAQAMAQAEAARTELTALEDQQPSGLMGQVNGILQNGLILFGTLFALVLAVLGFLVLKRRRDEAAAETNAFNPALAGGIDAVSPPPGVASYAAQAPEPASSMAGMLARFRRSKDADQEQHLDDQRVIADLSPVSTAAQPASAAAPVVVAPVVAVPVAETRENTDKLLDDLGISDDMLSLDAALTSIDESSAHEPQTSVAGLDTALEDAELLSALELDEIHSEISVGTPPGSGTAVPAAAPASANPDANRVVEFSAVPVAAAAVAAAADQTEEPEAFEFTLREEPATASADPFGSQPDEQVESFEFTLRDTADADGDAIELDNDADELGSLSFDDTMLPEADDDEESPYKSRSGMDECDTKLDLATAYEAMGDVSEAIEILDEVIADGNPGQVEMARRLKQSWQSA